MPNFTDYELVELVGAVHSLGTSAYRSQSARFSDHLFTLYLD